MPGGCCGSGSCSCLIQAGDGNSVTGSGSMDDPYVVTSDFPDFSQSFAVNDTDTVNLTLLGSGNNEDPFILKADATLRMTQLADVEDAAGPAVGESPVWTGVGSDGHWEFKIPSTAPAGTVNVSQGIGGSGTSADPLLLEVSGTWGTAPLDAYGNDSTVGLAVYIDSNGEVRAQPPGSTTVAWSAVTGKPSTFPPSAHDQAASTITDQLALNVGMINGTPIYFAQTANSSWPNGTVWGSW